MMADEVFPGFPACLEDGFTPLPNSWFDILMHISNLAEFKVVFYVARHTWGYRDDNGDREEMKKITLDEFVYGRKRKNGTRLDRGIEMGLSAVRDGLKRAIGHGYLIHEVDDSDMARVKNFYGLKMAPEEEDEQTGENQNTGCWNSTLRDTETQNSDMAKPASRSEKETSETNFSKETMRNMSHSQFFDETLVFIKKKEIVTFYQLERYLHRFIRVRGKINVPLKVKNVVVWTGITQEFLDMVLELQADKEHISLSFADEKPYEKGRKPRLPVTYKDGDHEEMHWRPMVIKYNKAQ